MAHLVTGYAGYAHIKSEDDAAFNASFLGSGQYVLESGNQFEGSIINNNTIRILDGDGLMYGRHFRIESNIYEDVTIETGTANKNRIDLICMTYEKNAEDGTEKVYLEVIKGTETEGTAVAPKYVNENILEGALKNQMPLYKVTIKGVVLSKIEPLFTPFTSFQTFLNSLPADIRENAHKATAASTTDLNEITESGIWYVYNKVCTGVPPELANQTILLLVKNDVFLNVTIQTITRVVNGIVHTWERRYTSTSSWGSWYKTITSNDMAKLRTMHIGIETLGVSTSSTITLLELFDLMDTVSETTFFITSTRYTEIYKEILAGIQTAYPNITSISAHVTIRKNGTTSYITVEDYTEPSNKFETIYRSGIADNWVKYITTSDTESRRMYINPSNFGCSNSDGTLDLVSMINKMDAKSHVNFWINNSGQFTKIYNEIFTGIKTKYPEVTNIFGNVDILKTDGTAYVKASQYDNPNNVFTAHYSTVNNVGLSNWEKVASGTDLAKKIDSSLELLWTNEDPTSSFASITKMFSTPQKYKSFKFVFKIHKTLEKYITFDVFESLQTRCQYIDPDSYIANVTNVYRDVIATENSFTINPVNGLTTGVVYNFMLIPYQVYGVR